MQRVLDNAAGPTGVVGIIISKFPDCPADWLMALSTILVICQLIHWAYRLINWIRK